MNNANRILQSREERNRRVIKRAASCDVITVKANVPGQDKRIAESFLVVRRFTQILLNHFGGRAEIFDGDDGMYAIVYGFEGISKDGLVKIETENPTGRFADLDFYPKGAISSVSRGHMRRCFICERPAFVCAKEGTHGIDELTGILKNEVRKYFSAHLGQLIKDSLMTELNLEDKFGLVSPVSQGSHKDLGYAMMARAQDAVIPGLIQMFWQGFDDSGITLDRLRPSGLAAEAEMLKVTGGANAYKGMIFVLGVLLASTGRLLASGSGYYGGISVNVRKICKGVTDELRDGRADGTYGAYAFKKYGVTGVRGHAERGFDVVDKAAGLIDGEYSDNSLLKALCFITGRIDDTVLMKRSGSADRYHYFKQSIASLDPTDKQKLKILNEECLNANVSIGGAADVLVAGVMLKKIRSSLYFDR